MESREFWPTFLGFIAYFVGGCIVFFFAWKWWKRDQVELPEHEQDDGYREEHRDDLAKQADTPAEDVAKMDGADDEQPQ